MNRLLLLGLLALIAGGLIGGFMVAGGPGYARMEAQDRQRARDLREWGQYHACRLRDQQESGARCVRENLPPDRRDPETGEAYRFSRTDADSFEVCATFRTTGTERAPSYELLALDMDGSTGCLRYRRQGVNGDWVQQQPRARQEGSISSRTAMGEVAQGPSRRAMAGVARDQSPVSASETMKAARSPCRVRIIPCGITSA